MPSWLIAVLVPLPLSEQIEAFREPWGVRESPAHVTLKARAGLNDDLDWLAAVEAVAQGTAPIRVSISGPRTFGRKVVYLGVSGDGLKTFHLRLLDALNPVQRFAYEGLNFTPHLSLALARRGVDLGRVLVEANTAFDDLDRTPFTFSATHLWVMRKAGPGALYLPWQEIRLGTVAQPE